MSARAACALKILALLDQIFPNLALAGAIFTLFFLNYFAKCVYSLGEALKSMF